MKTSFRDIIEDIIWKIRFWCWDQKWLPHQWYHEYKNHVRMHDYINVMVNNYPILTWRRLDFGLHEETLRSCHLIGVMGYKVGGWTTEE